ncbi:MAG: alanine dehydrogenase [Bacteroidota bacterium]|jgi:alanine dehydrogenase|nr:alanine dehydrogenase [Bacteroidales bacterium]MDI9536077.1 alanine dehydrogenase [Bacteroidota bacterium]NLP20859.1 alanine dehydrogenase [Bacteroidales bacterium]HNY43702.1 alanine dehydrogenase [Bacteroidales bacterium]
MTEKQKTNVFIPGSVYLPQEEMLELVQDKKKFRIGMPADKTGNERRVPLAPLAVEVLVNEGFEVVIQDGAGKGAYFSNHEYSKYGAEITTNLADVFSCDIIVKICPLTIEEMVLLRGNQIIITSLHSTYQTKEYFQILMKKKVTALAFDMMRDSKGANPIVRSMSEIAGRSAVLIASEYLNNIHKGKGEMLGGITGVSPSEVVVIGAGIAGTFATQTAIALGAHVKVFDNSIAKLDKLQSLIGTKVFTSTIYSKVLLAAIKTADVVIGAVRINNNRPNIIVTEDMVMQMKKQSIIVDISIDQGGIFETSKPTTHKSPVFTKHGVIHYCVPNIASRVARTASYSISNILSFELLKIQTAGSINSYLKTNAGVRYGVYIYDGILTDENIGQIHGLMAKDINLLLAAM